jgi:excinuclease ABC subunit C
MELAQNMHFEEAQKIKKIEVLENYQSRSTIVNPKSPISMCSIVSDESAAYVNFLQIHMVLLSAHTMEIKKKLEETDAELLELAIIELRERFQLLSRVIVPFRLI